MLAATAVLAACDHRSHEPSASAGSAMPPNATVMSVIDGDTIVVEHDDGRTSRVRLIGIDTPEIAHGDDPAECFGPQAARFTAGLLAVGSGVHLQRDVEARDDYGRLLAYVYRSDDGLFVNVEIVRRGYATPLRFEPNVTFAALFADAARAAQDGGLGLWATCSPRGADR